ncbi:MAG: C39 family peptidase [Elusimicrobiota bacterium]
MTFLYRTPLDLANARFDGVSPIPFSQGLLEGSGVMETPAAALPQPFDDLVGSWNAAVPAGGSVEMQAQVRQDGRWSRWYGLSVWVPGGGQSLGRQEDEGGFVDVDTLRLKRKADAFRVRLVLISPKKDKTRLRSFAVVVDDTTTPMEEPSHFVQGPWVRTLEVPPRSQNEESEEVRHDICSPTSLAMVMEYWGRKVPTRKLADEALDHAKGIYGNWPLNVAAAAVHGLCAYVTRLPSLAALQDEVAADRPVVVSITVREGEALNGAPYRTTRGHLLVVLGFTPDGDVVVNDPAAKDRASVRRIYRRAEFERAWLRNKRGVAYVVSERFPADFVVAKPEADLLERPSPLPKRATRGLLSQVLYGETVRVLDARGGWVRVRVHGQLHSDRRGSWGGYPGWLRADALLSTPPTHRPNAVIRARRAELRLGDAAPQAESLTLSLGSLLDVEKREGSQLTARLLDGRAARVDPDTVFRLDVPLAADIRRAVLEAGALFLGDPYFWGGRSSLGPAERRGVDCSGLIHLAYRTVGLTLPRDAQHQFLRCKRVDRQNLAPADLVFLTRSNRSKRVTHVMLYTGTDGILESRESAKRALRTTFTQRFGVPLDSIESGSVVTDLSRRKPLRRRIYFGSFLGGI